MANMELSLIGFDLWFQEQQKILNKPGLSAARVSRVDRDRYLVLTGRDEISAEITGNLLYSSESNQNLPCVGDWVLADYYNDNTLAIIHDVLPRKSFLHRKAAGKNVDYQLIASNIDTAFITQSCDNNFNVRRLERYLVIAKEGGIRPVVLLSKSDLVGPGELQLMLNEIGKLYDDVPIVAFSNLAGDGLPAISRLLEGSRTYCLLGSSGVGKTTLLNHLLGREEFETTPVREKDSRGRHTTSRRQLVVLENGALIIDTPGMRELGIIAADSEIDDSFSEISVLAADCRFRDCTHTREAGCAILKALEDGRLDEQRYGHYLKLRKESEFYQMSYVERRKKDKQFGKMANAVLKEVRRRKPLA
jgi:ribosome biogenesis GTPase / thiamine phosphate phosphatase